MPHPPSRVLILAALALCAGQGCDRRPPTEAERTAQAQEVVRRFFTALPEGDCAVLGPLLEPERPGHPSREVVAEMNDHGLRLMAVLDAKVDGRDANAVIVRVRVQMDGKPKEAPMLIRVEKRPDGWKLRL